jgi:hypothetical protein
MLMVSESISELEIQDYSNSIDFILTMRITRPLFWESNLLTVFPVGTQNISRMMDILRGGNVKTADMPEHT